VERPLDIDASDQLIEPRIGASNRCTVLLATCIGFCATDPRAFVGNTCADGEAAGERVISGQTNEAAIAVQGWGDGNIDFFRSLQPRVAFDRANGNSYAADISTELVERSFGDGIGAIQEIALDVVEM